MTDQDDASEIRATTTWRLSPEFVISFAVLFTGIIGSYISLAQKVDTIANLVQEQHLILAQHEQIIHAHQALPMHPVAGVILEQMRKDDEATAAHLLVLERTVHEELQKRSRIDDKR